MKQNKKKIRSYAIVFGSKKQLLRVFIEQAVSYQVEEAT